MSLLTINRPDMFPECKTCMSINRTANDAAAALGNEGELTIECNELESDSTQMIPVLRAKNNQVNLTGDSLPVKCPGRAGEVKP